MQRNVDALKDDTFDLLILGGGITGAGVALDAATRGLRVALIDKGDFASGTSSASSKLIHGGLRYLEHGDLGLVYEAQQERRLLLANAPHLVRPLRFVIPFCRGARVPAWKWRLGLTLYDTLAGRHNLHRSRPLRVAELRRDFPALQPPHLYGGSDYHDAQMDDARLCIEVLQTAARHGATVANYVEALAFETPGQVRILDHVDNREGTIRARQVLNAAGPWADNVRRLAGDDTCPLLQPTKGVHLIVADRGWQAAFLLLHPVDGRVLFVIPWLGKTLIGTTDTITGAGADALQVEPEEIEYLLAAHNHYFAPPLSAGDVLGSFAGLRPLIRARPGEPSSRSREFRIVESPSGLVSIAGGKYTTYRHMAEAATDVVLRRLGLWRRCRTRNLPLDGTPAEPWTAFAPKTIATLQSQYHLEEASAKHLVDRYARRAVDVAALLQRQPNLAQPVVPGEPDLLVEFIYQREREMAIFPADHWLRRSRIGLFHPAHLQEQVAKARQRLPA
jgi:glycerol-3-phosphate dehydrogenase